MARAAAVMAQCSSADSAQRARARTEMSRRGTTVFAAIFACLLLILSLFFMPMPPRYAAICQRRCLMPCRARARAVARRAHAGVYSMPCVLSAADTVILLIGKIITGR